MKLSELITSLSNYEVFGEKEVEVASIVDDSRKVSSGSLFVAIKGLISDGHKFISQAIANSASVVVGEVNPNPSWIKRCSYVKVENSRRALSFLAAKWYEIPADKLKIIGVTGTKGKTTTAFILYNILQTAGKKVGLISSIITKVNEKDYETGLHVTSPEPLKLQEFLSLMVKEKCEYVVLEVTSHGLDQDRIVGVNFEIGILTNIAHEHLDYHKTFDNYKRVKAKLFEVSKFSILNKDDPFFDFFCKRVGDLNRIITYSTVGSVGLVAKDIHENAITSFRINENGKEYGIKSNLLGTFNIANVLAAVSAARKVGIDWKYIQKAVSNLPQIPGRLEEVKNNRGFKIYIDFAHTPDSLEKVLTYLKKKTNGKLICVFGCAGERDVNKRAAMGEISGKLADISIFTAEDPRSEDVYTIISQIEKGAKKSRGLYYKIPERGEAISFALQKIAQSGDTIIFCGKGHEKSMAYEGVEHPWSEKETIDSSLDADSKRIAIVLAGGKGTRMNSDLAKVLHKMAGRPMISYTLSNLRKAGFGEIIVVVGYKKDLVIENIGYGVIYGYQRKPLGTGDALYWGLKKVAKESEDILVMNGDDSAFYKLTTFNKILICHNKKRAVMTFATLILENPFGIGRVARNAKGKLLKIVEEKEATDEERKIKEANIGLYVFKRSWLEKNIKKIKKSPSGEYYIVDLVKIALDRGEKVGTYELKNNNEWFGVNTLEQLDLADNKMRELVLKEL